MMSVPSIRGFQLDDSAIGAAAKSVNLYRGDVNLPLKLLDLDGPHGFNVSLAAYYGSNVDQRWDTWNLEAPTGALGLGWSLPFSYVAFSGGGTASWLEGSFELNIGGNAHPLVMLSYTGTAAAGNENLTFADPLNPLWSLSYTPKTETWTIVRDDGVTMVFGDSAAARGTVQWGVRWDNWAGNSSADSGSPTLFALAWNLSTMSDPWGNSVSYGYLLDSQPVSGSLGYTRACYLKQILDAYGRTVVLSYEDKKPLEYQAPHTVDGKTPTGGYQDRYETQYLSQIDVYAPGGVKAASLYYALIFGYQLEDPEHSTLTNTCKRYLVSLAQQRNGIDVVPAMAFAYQLDPSKPGPGRLAQATYPSGGTVSWTYDKVALADPGDPDNIFNLTYTAKRPTDTTYSSATPRLWFGSDYVIVAWYGGDSLALRVYSYGGRWSEPYCHDIDGVSPQTSGSGSSDADKLEQVHIAMGPSFFALHFHNQGTTSDPLYIFQKAIDQFGLWTPNKFTVNLGGSSVTPDETALVAGKDFAALHVGGNNHLFRFRYSPVTQSWTADDPVSFNNSATRIALAAQHNTLAACFFAGSSSVTGKTVIYYLKGDYSWGESSSFDPTTSFDWDAGVVGAYWRFGSGFVVGTCFASGTAHLQFISWQRNFAGFSQLSKSVYNGSQSTWVGGNAVFNGGTLYRFSGASWVSDTLGWKAGDLLAASDDVVLRVRRYGSYYNQNELATFDAQSNQWRISGFQNDGDLEAYEYPSGPQFSGDFLTVSNQVFYRGTDNDWQPVASHNPLPHCYGSTVANLSPGFVAWQSADNRSNPNPSSLESSVALPKNGDLLTVPSPYSGQKMQSLDGATVLCGANAFATYDAAVSEFSHVGQFTLHRVLNHATSDQSACVVVGLSIDTGQQILETRYDYDATTAVFDASGTVAQFPKVTATRISALDGSDQGKTEYQYYNGQAPSSALNTGSETCLTGSSDPDSLDAHYSLANGYLHTVTDYDEADTEVAVMENAWVPVIYDDTFTSLQQVSTLRSGTVTHTFKNLAITNLDGTADSGDTAALNRNQSFSYDPATARVSGNSLTQYNSRGEQETRTIAYTFAWAEYPGMKSQRRLREQAKVVLSTKVGSQTTAVQAMAQTYTDQWGSAGTGWDHQAAWRWLGSGSPDFDFTQSSHDGWVCESAVSTRNKHGFKTLTTDALGVPTSTLYDGSGLWPVATLINASSGLYTGFETYEAVATWKLSGGAAVVSGDAHSGSQCLHLPKDGTVANSSLSVASGQWVFSCWVKSSGTSDASWTLEVGASSSNLKVPSTAGWQYLFSYLSAAQDPSAVTLSLTNSGSGTLLVDEVRFTPLACEFSAKVYDSDTWYPIAKLGPNGEAQRTFYDDRLRTIASAGPDDNVATIHSLYYTAAGTAMFDASAPDPNSSLSIKASDGGVWEDFRDSNWSSRWSGDASAWKVENQVLTHQASDTDTVTLAGSESYQNIAAQVRVTASGAISGELGISVGTDLKVQWSSSNKTWELVVGAKVVDSAAGTASDTMHWLLIAGEKGVVFFLNDRQILTTATASGIGGSLGLFATDAGIGFSQVLVALTPVSHLAYLDGTHQAVQHQQLADDQIVVQETVYDELGRGTIHTKPISFESTVTGYRSDVVSGFDFSSGLMTGAVSDYYAGQDGRSNDNGYPYHRQRIENSSLARPLEQGLPGKVHAIGATGSHTTRYSYGVNGSSALFDAAGEQQYKLGLTLDPQGNATARLTDLVGNSIGQVRGGKGLPKGSLVSACLRDYQDNPAEIRSPNWYAPPSGTASDWTESRDFDSHNRPLSHDSSDEGDSDSIRDSQGRLRYQLLADGQASGAINPCQGESATPVAIQYFQYDAQGRIVEQGRYCVAAWSDVSQHADDQSWPPNAPGWRYRHSYDGDGSEPYCIGRLTESTTNNGATVTTECYSYDIRGKVTSCTVDDGTDAALTTTHGFDASGRPTSVGYPAWGGLAALKVVYAYNPRGLLATIGTSEDADRYARYTYNASGQVETVTLANASAQPITRSYSYTPAGWPRSITDSGNGGTLSAETLYYDEPNADSSNSPRYDGLLSAVQYTRAADKVDYGWTYGYDSAGRLVSADLKGGSSCSYAYDGNGNPTQITRGDDATTLTYSSSNVLQAAGSKHFSSAPSGEVTSAGTQSIGYDYTSRLTTTITDSSSGNTLTLSYGSSAQRLRKALTDSAGKSLAWRRYLPGPRQRSLQEQNWDSTSGETSEVRHVYGAHGIVAMESDGTDYFLLHDHERSPRLLLADAASEPAAILDYLPFGSSQTTAGGSHPDLLRYRYTGQEWDAEVGLYNFRHRLYDPTIQRFCAPDPKHQYFSPYIYVGDHPLLLTDPTGDWGIGNIVGIVGASVQIAAGAVVVGVGAYMGNQYVMAAGGALIGGGVADEVYSARAKHVKAGKFFEVDAVATVATAEFEAGILISSESGGLALAVGSGALTGGGGAAYTDVLKQVASHPDAKLDWGELGIAESTGAIAGAITGGMSWGIGSSLGVMGSEAASSAASDVADDVASNVAEDSDFELTSAQRTRRLLLARTVGRFVGGSLGETYNYGMTAWYRHTKVNAGQWALDSVVVGGEQAAAQFATGLLSTAMGQASSNIGKFAFKISPQVVRVGISTAWGTLMKLP